MGKKLNIAVIGAGLGGLSAAIRLAHLGHSVKVFESNSIAGGKASSFTRNGFRFDMGPSLLTMPFVLEELFTSVNENINDYLQLERLDPACKYFYPDKTTIHAYADINDFAEEVSKKTKDSSKAVLKYFQYSKRIYDLTSELFLFKSFSDISTFTNLKALKTLINLKALDTFRSMHKANKSFFKDEKIIQLFDRYATYNGSNPFTAPATLNIIQHVEFGLGAFIPKRGIIAISDSLYKLALKKGVTFYFDSKVEKINIENKKVTGLIINGVQQNFDLVISNSDVLTTYEELIPNNNSKIYKRYKKLEPSTSALVFYWGIKGIHKKLETHNIFFSNNYKAEFEELFNEKVIPNDPTTYIYISSKYKNDDAPKDCENWFVMVNAPYIENQNWEKEISKARKSIIRKINSSLEIDVESKIQFEEVLTPLDIQTKTSSSKGSLYGISSNTKMAAFLRQQNRSKDYKGLYFVGGSAHPGGGIPLVVLSGKIACELIEKHEK